MNKNPQTRIGILGVTGYAGRELLSLVARHPRARVAFGAARSAPGVPFAALVRHAPDGAVRALDDVHLDRCDVVFSCLPHGASAPWVERARAAGCLVIDLSADLRVPADGAPGWRREAVYGLPELHRERIRTAELVANPGCYPTAVLLAIAPLLRRGLIDGPVIADAASGTTGAGRTARSDLLFAEVAESFRAYAAGNVHRHLTEMRDQATRMASGGAPDLVFTPHLLPIRRGILATVHVPLREQLDDPVGPWREDFGEEPFVAIADDPPSIAEVAGSNDVRIAVVRVEGVRQPRLTVFAAIDNLGKGAAGQAIQNMNLMMGWPETEGLR